MDYVSDYEELTGKKRRAETKVITPAAATGPAVSPVEPVTKTGKE